MQLKNTEISEQKVQKQLRVQQIKNLWWPEYPGHRRSEVNNEDICGVYK